MGDCHLGLPYKDEKSCKFSYSTWCPTCERNPPRRRSKSEVMECRRKSKEMKTSTKKYTSHEYENMEMDNEIELKNYWLDRPEIRNNLCELPTSYISNNCQLPKYDKVDIVNRLERSVKTYEQTLKFADEIQNRGFFTRRFELRQSHIDRDISYDTNTYFNNINDMSNLRQRYNEEINILKDKYKRTDNNNIDNMMMIYKTNDNVLQTKNKLVNVAIKKNPKITLKVKPKISNSSKLKRTKYNNNKTLSPATISVESDFSDTEESISNLGDETHSVCESPSSLLIPIEKVEKKSLRGAGDAHPNNIIEWPLRESLFPNIPPYIRFRPYNSNEQIQLPVGKKYFKWKLSTITPIVVRKTLNNSGFALVRKSNQWLGQWGKHMKSPMFKSLKEYQKLNHFPGTFQLGRKDRLWRNFQKLINRHGFKEFGFIPQSYILPQELKLLKQNWDYKSGNGNMWIIKPPASARGVGIKVIHKWSQLPKKTSLVVQRYISNPYLINHSKFDLRLYVLVTSFNPLRIYLYPDGLARFASAKYSDNIKDTKDRYVHLTNYSINKLSSQYSINEDANSCHGHKWTLKKLFEYMEHHCKVDTKLLWKTLQSLVIKTIISAEDPVAQICKEHLNNRYNCYELFGIDVLLDENLKPWLLEVNISPSLHSQSPLDAHVKGPMVQTLFDLAQFHMPQRLGQAHPNAPPCYNPKLYTTNLTRKERDKHNLFVQYEKRCDYINDIINGLTGDDVRHLTQAEDEYTVKGEFLRIFPTSQTYKYLDFMEPRYYNRLFDAWETRYESKRKDGIKLLKDLCAKKIHLRVATSQNSLNKNGLNMNDVHLNLQSTKAGLNRPLNEIMQEVSITTNTNNNTISSVN